MDSQYVDTLERLYRGQTGQIVADKKSRRFSIKKGDKAGRSFEPRTVQRAIRNCYATIKGEMVAEQMGAAGDFDSAYGISTEPAIC